jgi:hypothetical protein
MEDMTPEAKSAVMQLMGQTYGQVKKQDAMLVGASSSLQPKSTELKGMVENLVRVPTAPSNQQLPPQVQGPPPQQAPLAPIAVTPEQAQLELQQVAAPVDPAFGIRSEPGVEETMEFDFSEPSAIDKLVELQKETNLLLKGIKIQLENSNVRPKRKSAKAKIAD